MQLQNLLLPVCLFSMSLVRAWTLPYVRSTTITVRGLFGLLGGENILGPTAAGTTPLPPGTLTPQRTSASSTEAIRTRTTIENANFPTLAALAGSKMAVASISTDAKSHETAFLLQTITPGSLSDYLSNVPSSTSPATTGWIGDASTTPPAELMEWKVIGIGVITVTLIAITILSISFFDSWWGFVRSLICGKTSSPEGEETMVPDWNQRSWEFRIANEDGHRYPTLSSLESIVKEKENSYLWSHSQSTSAATVTTPELAYGGK